MKVAIKSLRIVGCGPIDDLDLDFTDAAGTPRPITLLAGANGSGKTTILEVLFALLDSAVGTVKPMIAALTRKAAILSRCTYAQLTLTIDKQVFEITHEMDESDDGLPERHTDYDGPGAANLKQAMSVQLGESFDYVEQMLDGVNASRVAPSTIYFPPYRALSPTSGTRVESEHTKYEWTHRVDTNQEFKGSLNSYLVWTEYAEPATFERIRSAITDIYPDRRTVEIDRKRLTAVVVLENGSRHDLDLLSSGEQNLLIILIELRRHLIPGSIVLIDEIENSLHPAFQYRLGLALGRLQKSVDFQLVATTHSATFVDVFGAETTLLLPSSYKTPNANQAVTA